ncbi:MAG TPA: ATP-binding protein [Thermodesulfovibrionia bacterium]|nr:ATP-binding protein [Thermodesulfovibrionia bacterium]
MIEKRRSGNLPFDQYPVVSASLDDLDISLFQKAYLPFAISPEVLELNERSIEQQLISLRFLSKKGIPDIASIIVFGKDPVAWIGGAYIQFLRIDGTEITDPIKDQKVITGPMPYQISQLDEILKAHIFISSDVTKGLKEQKQPDYPFIALQQLTRNAILHRTYESTNAPTRIYWFNDRIEIHNPGGLYGQVNESNFGKGVTDYRNPLLAEAMKVLGYVQRFGMGIPLAYKECQKNGNPVPEFTFNPSYVLVTVKKVQ